MNVNLTLLAKPNETIEQHINKVLHVARILLNQFSKVIHNFSKQITDDFFLGHEEKETEIVEFILEVVQFHDYGKVNPALQDHFHGKNKSKSERRHALYSFLLWLQENNVKLAQKDKQTLEIRSVLAYASIAGHHSFQKEFKEKMNDENFNDFMDRYIPNLHVWGQIDEHEVDELSETVEDFLDIIPNGKTDVALTFSKFVYSILIVSDSIASSDILESDYEAAIRDFFCKDIKDTNIHQNILEAEVIRSVQNSLLKETDSFQIAQNMNDIRVLLNKKSVAAWEEQTDIYVLEAPVGTGKTLSSLVLANELVTKENKRKIISVFPLNSVQSQYKHTIMNDIKVQEQFLNVINSESLFKVDVESHSPHDEEARNFTITDSNLWLFERNFFSNEFIITSHVRFFDTLTAISRKSSLGFLNLMDSVVIIDEFQNYPDKYWKGIWGDLLRLSELFGVKWIFTTGTFPVSKTQLTNSFGNRIKYVLSDEENESLFLNSYVKNRCEITLLSNTNYESIEPLAADVLTDIKTREVMDGYSQFIICLSYVRHAKDMYQLLHQELTNRGYTCYFLCGRHSASYKEELMRIIKNHNQNRTEKIVLITTKTVECGMDFDFDYGYKEFDMFDSVEQLTGRVNRSGYREKGGTGLFYLKRKVQEKEKLYDSNEQVLVELQNKRFRWLYEDMFKTNKIDLKTWRKKIDTLHNTFQFKEYRDFMTIIKDTDYCTDIYLIKRKEEEEFLNKVNSLEQANEYAEKVIQSIKLRKKLELYRMTVTTKWLEEQINNNLIAREIKGILYFVLCDDDNFDSLVEEYKVNEITSYLEKNYKKEETYEFY